jgi:hypothetical protein
MTSSPSARLRGYAPGAVALAVLLVLFFVARLPNATAKDAVAAPYKFTEMPIAMPAGYHPTQTVRQVNPEYYHIRSWVSSVGAGIAMNDLTGHGRPDAMCIVDPRTDQVVVTYAPTAPDADRFIPFVLNPAPTLPMDSAMAPMGCVPGDFNGDGRMDLLVYYWGRTPVLFLAKADATTPSPAAYQPVELVPSNSVDGRYHGPRWNTNAANVADFDGTGHPGIFIGNYYPDSDVLNPHGQANVVMNSSMSNAKNAGGDHMLRWYSATAGPHPSASYVEERGAIPYKASTGWTLAASSADLTGSGKPDLYIANDFGKGHLLYNTSTPGHISFSEATGQRGPTTPKSFVLGHGSFKGMGVDFGDLDHTGKFDIFIGNITTAWGLEESNFLFMNTAQNNADMKRQLAKGVAPFTQQAQERGLAWTGWSWDGKIDDFRNSGYPDIVQADGFVKGKINRWPWLQEMAMANDDIYTNPSMWPDVQPGDDVAGDQTLRFWARTSDGKFVDIGPQLGLAVPTPTRGIATADTRGTGALDFAVARQWERPAFYANQSTSLGHYLGLYLIRRSSDGKTHQGLEGAGTPAYGATVQITTPDGRTQISQLDGGGGHSGKRSFEVRFGLGSYNGPVSVRLQWSDAQGRLHDQTLRLTPGEHTLCLMDSMAEEVPSR